LPAHLRQFRAHRLDLAGKLDERAPVLDLPKSLFERARVRLDLLAQHLDASTRLVVVKERESRAWQP
jgi:hypothetical protein